MQGSQSHKDTDSRGRAPPAWEHFWWPLVQAGHGAPGEERETEGSEIVREEERRRREREGVGEKVRVAKEAIMPVRSKEGRRQMKGPQKGGMAPEQVTR